MWSRRTATHHGHVTRCGLGLAPDVLKHRLAAIDFQRCFTLFSKSKCRVLFVVSRLCSALAPLLPWCRFWNPCQVPENVRYGMLNLVVFLIGFLSNLNGGFQGSWAYPFAKANPR